MSAEPRRSESAEDRTAEACMFLAFDSLKGAAERFRARGDDKYAVAADELAGLVAELDPAGTEVTNG